MASASVRPWCCSWPPPVGTRPGPEAPDTPPVGSRPMFNVGGPEVLVILLVALIALGPAQLPGAARKVGQAMAEIRKVSTSFQRELTTAFDVEERKATEKPQSKGGPAEVVNPPEAIDAGPIGSRPRTPDRDPGTSDHDRGPDRTRGGRRADVAHRPPQRAAQPTDQDGARRRDRGPDRLDLLQPGAGVPEGAARPGLRERRLQPDPHRPAPGPLDPPEGRRVRRDHAGDAGDPLADLAVHHARPVPEGDSGWPPPS